VRRIDLGQKVQPIGFRLGYIKTWDSRWYSGKNFAKSLHEDLKIRDFLKKRLFHAGVSRIEVERAANKITATIYTARPGIVIGRKGAEIEVIKQDVGKMTSKEITLNIQEVRKPDLDAQLVAENIALQLERRIGFRRVMRKAVMTSRKMGALGIKVMCAGRLGGAEIARTEWFRDGRVPLHTLRADIDYGFTESKTTYGIIGVKVWIFKGEVLSAEESTESL
jgi:small subunit ribosomal protein S3